MSKNGNGTSQGNGKPHRNFPQVSDPKKRAFLAALAETGNATAAAEISQVTDRSHRNWKRDDADYADAAKSAMEMAGDILESEARRRAKDGWNEPVWYKGEECGAVRKFSDTLLIFLLKGAKPDKYADRRHVEQNVTLNVAEFFREAAVKRAEFARN